MDNVLIGGRQSALLQPPKPIAPPATSALMSPTAMSSLPAPPLVPAAPPKKKETGYRDIFDPVATRTAIFEDVRQAARDTPEIANQRHILRLKDVDYDGDQRYDYTAQKKAILSNKSLNRRLLGTWELIDKATGNTLDQKRMTVAHVPYMTERGTFINNGLEYVVKNQMRLRPGVFARVKENGEIESHANIMPGKGFGHRYYLDPEKETFYMKVHQAKIPLMPLMRALGATDKQLIEAWGPRLFAANQQTDGVGSLNKMYDKVMGDRGKDTDPVARRLAIAEAFNKMEVDPDVMQRTLGKPHKTLGLDSVLDITKKLLGISRGEQDVDDRDHMAYQTIHGVEDLMSERIKRDFGNLRRNLLYKSSFKGNLNPIQPGALSRQLNAVLLSSGLGQPLEELNPSEILDKLTAITRLGVGGIGDTDAIPRESRSVQPSHYGFLDLVRTPESLRAGVDIYLGAAVRKGKDGQIYAPFKDARTGETVYKSPHELSDLTVAFPGELNRRTKRIGAMRSGKMDFFPRNEVDLIQDNFENSFSPLAQLVLGKSAMKAQRMSMGSRMSTQAVSLSSPESPLVQVGTLDKDKDESFEERYSPFMGAVKAKQPGRVVKVEKDRIDVRYADGTKETVPLYNNFIFNRKSYIHNTPMVRPGDAFQAGSLLAKSNYTDDKGVTALGLNARTGYMPYKGYNFEDAIVISRSMADRMKSEHAYQHSYERDDAVKHKKTDFLSLFPGKFDRKIMDRMDDDGIIKEGQTVNYGEPLILAARQRDDAQNKLHKKKQSSYSDATELWTHHSPGVVTDVMKTEKGVLVAVKSASTMQVGDKMSGRFGDKGVIAAIVDDDKMPKGEDGNPLEVLTNDLGIISRANPIQIYEALLGKIARKSGKSIKLQDFSDISDLNDWVMKECKKYNIKAMETITDPENNRQIPNILTGDRFFMKLSHMSDDKLAGRATGGYTMNETPAKGGPEGSKALSLLDVNALLSHGATSVIRDAGLVRGQKNDDMWLSIMRGHSMPKPNVPYVYQRFINSLRAAGVNVLEDGPRTHIMAMTDKDVSKLSGDRFITNGETVDFAKGLKPIPGGLFDPKLTDGHNGTRWSAIKLHEPMPNPVMEEPIRRMLGLTQKKFESVLAGREKLDDGSTGPSGLKGALDKLDIDKELAKARLDFASGKMTKRDDAIRKMKYLKSAQKLGLHPRDWMLSKVPVLPARFRPIAVMSGNGLPLVADANYLYKEVLEANDNLQYMQNQVDDVGDERLALYHSFRAVTGLGDPLHPKLQEKRVKGVLSHIFGGSPKTGAVQRKLISSTVDLVGRAVITPNPDYDMDTVGIPEDKAWEVYKPFLVRRLVRRGMKMVQAMQAVADRSPMAKNELLGEMDNRPVIINRAPVLHRFGIMAFRPKLVPGAAMQISPLIVKGFNADFDGDAMQFHVPADDEAVKDAYEKMLPSVNLISPADFKSPVHAPSNEYTGGLYVASTRKSKRSTRTFRNWTDALAAFRRGDINIDDEIEVLQ